MVHFLTYPIGNNYSELEEKKKGSIIKVSNLPETGKDGQIYYNATSGGYYGYNESQGWKEFNNTENIDLPYWPFEDTEEVPSVGDKVYKYLYNIVDNSFTTHNEINVYGQLFATDEQGYQLLTLIPEKVNNALIEAGLTVVKAEALTEWLYWDPLEHVNPNYDPEEYIPNPDYDPYDENSEEYISNPNYDPNEYLEQPAFESLNITVDDLDMVDELIVVIKDYPSITCIWTHYECELDQNTEKAMINGDNGYKTPYIITYSPSFAIDVSKSIKSGVIINAHPRLEGKITQVRPVEAGVRYYSKDFNIGIRFDKYSFRSNWEAKVDTDGLIRVNTTANQPIVIKPGIFAIIDNIANDHIILDCSYLVKIPGISGFDVVGKILFFKETELIIISGNAFSIPPEVTGQERPEYTLIPTRQAILSASDNVTIEYEHIYEYHIIDGIFSLIDVTPSME